MWSTHTRFKNAQESISPESIKRQENVETRALVSTTFVVLVLCLENAERERRIGVGIKDSDST